MVSKAEAWLSSALSGLRIGSYVKDDLRFVTLTSSPKSPRPVQKSLGILVKRIRRFRGKFDYWCVRTSEGLGVLHLLVRGRFLPVAWLRHRWLEIHGAFEVWISRVYSFGIARYFVSQYMSGQSRFVRASSSRHWIFRGAWKVWRFIVRKFGFVEGLRVWKDALFFESVLLVGGFG